MWLLRSLKIAALLTPVVPARIGYAICRVLGTLYYLVNPAVRQDVDYNIGHVAPGVSRFRRRLLGIRVCITVVTNYYDLLRMRSVDHESVLDLVDIAGLEHIRQAHERGRGVIIVSAHVGNFSVMARLPAALGYHAAIIAEKVDPPALFSYKVRLRSAMGIEVIPPGQSTVRRVTRLLRENGMLLVAGDRDVTGTGLPVQFFGAETTLPSGPVVLAMRTGAALVPAYTIRTGNRRSTVYIGSEISLSCGGDWANDVQANLRLLASEMERMISRDPGQWAVLQSVWPPKSRFGRSDGLGSGETYFPETEPEPANRDVHRKAG